MLNKVKTYDNQLEKRRVQAREQILHNFAQILDMFPQYGTASHLVHILRRKNDPEENYYWSDEKFLKKIEHYLDELKNELLMDKETIKEDEEY